jgi:hypothetical protein
MRTLTGWPSSDYGYTLVEGHNNQVIYAAWSTSLLPKWSSGKSHGGPSVSLEGSWRLLEAPVLAKIVRCGTICLASLGPVSIAVKLQC